MLLGAVVVLSRSDRPGPPGSGGDDASASRPAPIDAPTIVGVKTAGLEVDLSWTWTDARSWDIVSFRVLSSAWDPEAGRFTGEKVVSEEGMENAASYPAGGLVRGTFSLAVPAAGLYAFRLEVLAKDRAVTRPRSGTGHDTAWRAWRYEKILVGADGWSVVPLPGTDRDLLQDARDSRFRFFFELYHGPRLVRDCDLDYAVGWPAALYSHDCDWDTGERALVLANPDPGTPGAWRLTFAWDDDGPLFGDLYVESELRDDGVPGEVVGRQT